MELSPGLARSIGAPAAAGCDEDHSIDISASRARGLEPFDATGRLRTTDNGNPIDPEGVMYDGTPIEGPADLREFLLKYEDPMVRTVVEQPEAAALLRELMRAEGLETPPEGRTLDSICVVDVCR